MEESKYSSIESLLEYIKEEKQRLVKEKKIKKTKSLQKVGEDEFLFQIPKHWKWVRLEEITINRDGERVPVSQRDRENREKIYDYYGASGVIDKIDNYIFDQSLLLIGEDGANLLSRSKPIAFIAHGKYWVNNHAHVIDSVSMIILKYLEWYMNFIDLSPYVTGSAQPKLTQAKLNSIPVALPPLAEQVRIVSRIESLFDKVDKAAGLVDEARDEFEKRRAAILERAFSGELTKKWREENGVSDDWKTEKLSEYITLISGQHIMNKDYNDEGIGIPYLTGPSDFEELYPVVSKWTKKPKALATTNDILITVKGSGVGKVNICNIEEVAISRQLMAIRCIDIENIYLFWYLKNEFNLLQQLSTGTAIPGLSRGDILDIEISVCSKEEQKEVVRILEDMLNKESEVEMLTDISDNIDSIKKSILAKAFRGELGSNDLDEESSTEILKNTIK